MFHTRRSPLVSTPIKQSLHLEQSWGWAKGSLERLSLSLIPCCAIHDSKPSCRYHFCSRCCPGQLIYVISNPPNLPEELLFHWKKPNQRLRDSQVSPGLSSMPSPLLHPTLTPTQDFHLILSSSRSATNSYSSFTSRAGQIKSIWWMLSWHLQYNSKRSPLALSHPHPENQQFSLPSLT